MLFLKSKQCMTVSLEKGKLIRGAHDCSSFLPGEKVQDAEVRRNPGITKKGCSTVKGPGKESNEDKEGRPTRLRWGLRLTTDEMGQTHTRTPHSCFRQMEGWGG